MKESSINWRSRNRSHKNKSRNVAIGILIIFLTGVLLFKSSGWKSDNNLISKASVVSGSLKDSLLGGIADCVEILDTSLFTKERVRLLIMVDKEVASALADSNRFHDFMNYYLRLVYKGYRDELHLWPQELSLDKKFRKFCIKVKRRVVYDTLRNFVFMYYDLCFFYDIQDSSLIVEIKDIQIEEINNRSSRLTLKEWFARKAYTYAPVKDKSAWQGFFVKYFYRVHSFVMLGAMEKYFPNSLMGVCRQQWIESSARKQ